MVKRKKQAAFASAAAGLLATAGIVGGAYVLTARVALAGEGCVRPDNGRSGPGHFLFITSACENAGPTEAVFPLHKGKSHGETVWYVNTESSDEADALARGVNFSPKLANAKGTAAVQVVTIVDGVVNFPATVDFSHKRVLVPGPNGFPPAKATPGPVGEPAYTPLIELPNGIVLNAPQIANESGKADKVLDLDTKSRQVTYLETHGFYEDKHVNYASFDSSSPVAAAIEDVTFAPALDAAPSPGAEGLPGAADASARETLTAFVNGPTGITNPDRQGLNSTLLDKGLSPLNQLHTTPILPLHSDIGDDTYAPLWDIHLLQWTDDAIAAGTRIQIRSVTEAMDRVTSGAALSIGPGGPGSTFQATGFIVNCPLISIESP
jgi:hypothetical protein